MPTKKAKMVRKNTRTAAHTLTIKVNPEIKEWLEESAEANMREVEQQVAWLLNSAMKDAKFGKVVVHNPTEPIAPPKPVKAWSPLTDMPTLKSEPPGPYAELQAIGTGMDKRPSFTVSGVGKVYRVPREMASAVTDNMSLSMMNLKLKPLGEWGDWGYFTG